MDEYKRRRGYIMDTVCAVVLTIVAFITIKTYEPTRFQIENEHSSIEYSFSSENIDESEIRTTILPTEAMVTDSTIIPVMFEESTIKSTTKSVNISTTKHTEKRTGENDLGYLAAVIYQEAGSDYLSNTLRQYVGEVVMNRVKSQSFPNTVYEVLTQKGQYGKYHITGVSPLDKSTSAKQRAYRAAELVAAGSSDVPDNVVYQSGIKQGSGVWKVVDGVYFCYE